MVSNAVIIQHLRLKLCCYTIFNQKVMRETSASKASLENSHFIPHRPPGSSLQPSSSHIIHTHTADQEKRQHKSKSLFFHCSMQPLPFLLWHTLCCYVTFGGTSTTFSYRAGGSEERDIRWNCKINLVRTSQLERKAKFLQRKLLKIGVFILSRNYRCIECSPLSLTCGVNTQKLIACLNSKTKNIRDDTSRCMAGPGIGKHLWEISAHTTTAALII